MLLLSVMSASLGAQNSTNWRFSHTQQTTAHPRSVWAVWTDVPNWPNWDSALRSARLSGEFGEGATGWLKPDKGFRVRFRIVDVEPGRGYTLKTPVPFGSLNVRRSLYTENGTTFFTHEVVFTGLFKKALGRRLGSRYRLILPEVMQSIARIAEQNDHP